MHSELAILKDKVAALTALVEGLLARPPGNAAPPPMIAEVNGLGQFLDWNGASYSPDATLPGITVYQPGGTLVLYRPQAQRWESFGLGAAFATLTATLSAGGNATATYLLGGSGSVPGGVNDKLLCPGTSLASGAVVAIVSIQGNWYVFDATCPCS